MPKHTTAKAMRLFNATRVLELNGWLYANSDDDDYTPYIVNSPKGWQVIHNDTVDDIRDGDVIVILFYQNTPSGIRLVILSPEDVAEISNLK